MYPCNLMKDESPALYTFYAITTLLVVILAICLIWSPFVHLVCELNTIVARSIIYVHKELFGCKGTCFFYKLEAVFTSHITLSFITFCCIIFALYLASGDFLRFAGCYVGKWPNNKALEKLKNMVLEVIEYLLNLTGNRKTDPSTGNTTVNFRTNNKEINEIENPPPPSHIHH